MDNENTNELYYLRFSGLPSQDNPESKEFDGAYINVWVNELDRKKAEAKAMERIEAENWVPEKLHESMICSENYYRQRKDLTDEELEEIIISVREALEYGVSVAFYCWDKSAPDKDIEYE